MSQNVIVIGGTNTFQSTPIEIMELDRPSKARLVKIDKTKIVIPGDMIKIRIPPSCTSNGTYVIEPKYDQSPPFCEPQIVEAKDDEIEIEVKGKDKFSPIKLKKNSSPIQIREVKECDEHDTKKTVEFDERFQLKEETKSFEEKMKEIQIDQAQNMSQDEKRKFRETCTKYKDVFGDDLPGYNNYYGEVKASIQFASKARPTPH